MSAASQLMPEIMGQGADVSSFRAYNAHIYFGQPEGCDFKFPDMNFLRLYLYSFSFSCLGISAHSSNFYSRMSRWSLENFSSKLFYSVHDDFSCDLGII